MPESSAVASTARPARNAARPRAAASRRGGRATPDTYSAPCAAQHQDQARIERSSRRAAARASGPDRGAHRDPPRRASRAARALLADESAEPERCDAAADQDQEQPEARAEQRHREADRERRRRGRLVRDQLRRRSSRARRASELPDRERRSRARRRRRRRASTHWIVRSGTSRAGTASCTAVHTPSHSAPRERTRSRRASCRAPSRADACSRFAQVEQRRVRADRRQPREVVARRRRARRPLERVRLPRVIARRRRGGAARSRR